MANFKAKVSFVFRPLFRIRRFSLLAASLVTACVALVLAAFLYRPIADEIAERLEPIFGPGVVSKPYPSVIKTTFLSFETEVIPVPRVRKGAGGGFARFGDGLLLMTHDGRVFFVSPDGELKATSVTLPDNGFADYEAHSKDPEHSQLRHMLQNYRYNGLNFVDATAFRGLLMATTYYDAEQECYANRVYKAEIAASSRTEPDALSIAAEDWSVLYEAQPCLPLNSEFRALVGEMASGRMVFVEPRTVLLTNGDYFLNELGLMRSLPEDISYGKIVAIDAIDGTARDYTTGHRNPSGIALDKEGNVWSVEHGAFGGDELNLILDGADYGWPDLSYGARYPWNDSAPAQINPGHHEGATRPTYSWLPSAAVSSLALVDGFDETWDGDMIVGSLGRDASRGRKLFRMRIIDKAVVFAEQIRIGERIRDVHQLDEETIALWMDRSEIVLLRKRDLGAVAEAQIEKALKALPRDLRHEVAEVFGTCRECHSVVKGDSTLAPSLYGIVDRPIGTTGYPEYSEAFRSAEGRWSKERLAEFIAEPEKMIEGTIMPTQDLSDGAIIDGIVEVLVGLTDPEE